MREEAKGKSLEGKRIEGLFKKTDKFLRSIKSLGDFESPVLIMLRRGGKSEFYEGVTGDKYTFKHSDGSERVMALDRNKLFTLPYWNKTLYGYVAHEDFPSPLPGDSVLDVEAVTGLIKKSISDAERWKEGQKASKIFSFGKGFKEVMIGIGLLIAIVVGISWITGYNLFPWLAAPAEAAANTTGQTIAILG